MTQPKILSTAKQNYDKKFALIHFLLKSTPKLSKKDLRNRKKDRIRINDGKNFPDRNLWPMAKGNSQFLQRFFLISFDVHDFFMILVVDVGKLRIRKTLNFINFTF